MCLWFSKPLITTGGSEIYQDTFLYAGQQSHKVKNDAVFARNTFLWTFSEFLLCLRRFQVTSGGLSEVHRTTLIYKEDYFTGST